MGRKWQGKSLRSWTFPWSLSNWALNSKREIPVSKGLPLSPSLVEIKSEPGPPLPCKCSPVQEVPGLGRWHSLPLWRVASQKERGREEADKRDSFCLDTNILVISTDGMRNTKKSTWQFRKNLAKCYIFLTYLCRVLDQAPESLQSRLGMGACLSWVVFISKTHPSPSIKVFLWISFLPPK